MALDFKKSKNKTLTNTFKKMEETNTQLVREIPLDKLVETELNEFIFGILDSDVSRLAEEIQEHGFTGSIDVVDLHNGTYQVISGHQRLRAVRSLAWKTIPCTVSGDLDEEEKYRKLIASNVLTRKITPLAYARAIEVFKERVIANNPNIKGSKRAYIAHFFNIAEGQVQRFEAISGMPEEIQEMCNSREFPYSALVYASTFTDEQKQELLQMIKTYTDKNDPSTISVTLIRQFINSIKEKQEREEARKKVEDLQKKSERLMESISSDKPVSPAPVEDGRHVPDNYGSEEQSYEDEMIPEMETDPTETLLEDTDEFESTEFASTEEVEVQQADMPVKTTEIPVPQTIDSSLVDISRQLTELTNGEYSVGDRFLVLKTINACREAIEKIINGLE